MAYLYISLLLGMRISHQFYCIRQLFHFQLSFLVVSQDTVRLAENVCKFGEGCRADIPRTLKRFTRISMQVPELRSPAICVTQKLHASRHALVHAQVCTQEHALVHAQIHAQVHTQVHARLLALVHAICYEIIAAVKCLEATTEYEIGT